MSNLNVFKSKLRESLEQVHGNAPATIIKQRVYIWTGRESEEPQLSTIVGRLCGCNVYVNSSGGYMYAVGRQAHIKIAVRTIEESITFLHEYSNARSKPDHPEEAALAYKIYREQLRRKANKEVIVAAKEVWFKQVLDNESREQLIDRLLLQAKMHNDPKPVLKKGVFFVHK